MEILKIANMKYEQLIHNGIESFTLPQTGVAVHRL